MGMIIQFVSGLRVEALLLAANADQMRVIVSEGNTLKLGLSAGIRENANWRRLERFVVAGKARRIGRPSRPKRGGRTMPNGAAYESCRGLVC